MKRVYELDVYKLAEDLSDMIRREFDKWSKKAQMTIGYQKQHKSMKAQYLISSFQFQRSVNAYRIIDRENRAILLVDLKIASKSLIMPIKDYPRSQKFRISCRGLLTKRVKVEFRDG